jgi:chromosome segregation ATPase
MARPKEQPARSTLGAIQDLLADGSQALIEGVQSVQRVVLTTGRGVETQVTSILGSLEGTLSTQLEGLLSRFASSMRDEVDRLSEHLRALEERLGEMPAIEDGIEEILDEILEPIRSLANGADQRAAASQARAGEIIDRMERLEQRVTSMASEANSQSDTELRARLDRCERRLEDFTRDAGGRLTEVGPLRERLTRIESRVLETSKEQIARAGEATGMRDRLARLEARLTDLSREQVARAVEAAGLRERVFRLEQRSGEPEAQSVGVPATAAVATEG